MEIPYRFELLTPLYLLSIFTNSFLVFAIWRQKKLSVTSFRFVACLSVSDVLLSVFGLAIAVVVISKKPIGKPVNNTLFVFDVFSVFFTNFSSVMILIISVDRFIHMKYLLRYGEVMTKCREVGLILINAILAFQDIIINRIFPRFEPEFLVKNKQGYTVYLVVMDILYMLLIFAVFVVYIITFRTIRSTTRKQRPFRSTMFSVSMPSRTNDETSFQATSDFGRCDDDGRRERATRRSDKRFAKGMMLVLSSMLLFYLPNISAAIVNNIVVLSNDSALLLEIPPYIAQIRYFTYVGIVLNCSINAVLLIVFSADLKRFTKRTFCCEKRVDVA